MLEKLGLLCGSNFVVGCWKSGICFRKPSNPEREAFQQQDPVVGLPLSQCGPMGALAKGGFHE